MEVEDKLHESTEWTHHHHMPYEHSDVRHFDNTTTVHKNDRFLILSPRLPFLVPYFIIGLRGWPIRTLTSHAFDFIAFPQYITDEECDFFVEITKRTHDYNGYIFVVCDSSLLCAFFLPFPSLQVC